MKGFSSRVRLLLLLAVGGLVLANVYFWKRPRQGEEQQLSISPTALALDYADGQAFPEFTSGGNGWVSKGQAVQSIAPFTANAGKGPDGGGRYLVFRLSGEATVGDFRRALLALAEAGVCQAGVVDSAPGKPSGQGRVRIFRIDWVLDQGQKRHCIPKQAAT